MVRQGAGIYWTLSLIRELRMNSIIRSKAFFGVLGGLSILRFLEFIYFKNTNWGDFAAAYRLEFLANSFGLGGQVLDILVTIILFASAGLAFAGISDKLRNSSFNRVLYSLIGLNSLILFIYVLEALIPEFNLVVAIFCLPVFFFPLWGYFVFGFYGGSDIFFLLITTLVQIFLLIGITTTLIARKSPRNEFQPSNSQATSTNSVITGGTTAMTSKTTQWTVRIPGQPENPVDTATLQNWAKSGFVRPDTMVTEVATGYAYQARQIPGVYSSKSFVTALLLSFFFGVFGVDRFYLGHVGVGLGKLFTFGGLGIWALIDFILIATKNIKDSQGVPLA
jgi:hypothetical protein